MEIENNRSSIARDAENSKMRFETKRISDEPDVVALDGSEVRVLCGLSRGGLAVFSLAPHAVSKAVTHRTIEEIWYFIAGRGRFWRKLGSAEEITEIGPGVSIALPTGTHFQYRCDGAAALVAVAVTMPPWPGDDEAYPVDGIWQPTL
jgi:mannose-6-phosphate isomerase-like protein (cupin superfamily)